MEKERKRVPVVVKKHSAENSKSVRSIANTLKNEGRRSIISDIAGSYTGTPIDGGIPEQDADDL